MIWFNVFLESPYSNGQVATFAGTRDHCTNTLCWGSSPGQQCENETGLRLAWLEQWAAIKPRPTSSWLKFIVRIVSWFHGLCLGCMVDELAIRSVFWRISSVLLLKCDNNSIDCTTIHSTVQQLNRQYRKSLLISPSMSLLPTIPCPPLRNSYSMSDLNKSFVSDQCCSAFWAYRTVWHRQHDFWPGTLPFKQSFAAPKKRHEAPPLSHSINASKPHEFPKLTSLAREFTPGGNRIWHEHLFCTHFWKHETGPLSCQQQSIRWWLRARIKYPQHLWVGDSFLGGATLAWNWLWRLNSRSTGSIGSNHVHRFNVLGCWNSTRLKVVCFTPMISITPSRVVIFTWWIGRVVGEVSKCPP